MRLAEIREGLGGLLERNGYTRATIRHYEREWDRIGGFLEEEYGDDEFDMGRGMAFLERTYGLVTRYNDGTLRQSEVQRLRVVHMLEDYQLHGVICGRLTGSRNPIRLEGEYAEAMGGYEAALGASGLSDSTRGHYGSTALAFLDYLQQRGVALAAIDAACLDAWLGTMARYKPKTVEQQVCGARHLLRHLEGEGRCPRGTAPLLVAPRVSRRASIPSAWDADDLRRVLAAVDRDGPLGKRDYAMLLLACVLGLRSGDIKALRVSDFDWSRKELSFRQHKTGRRLTLPVPDAVGWAVIDYLRGARPAAEGCDLVFVSHRPPFGPLAASNHLHDVVVRYMRRAGVTADGRRHGFHSLRHTTASALVEMGTPLPVVTQVMGHSDPDVTGVYLKLDLERLCQCVLDPADLEPPGDGGGGAGPGDGDGEGGGRG